MGFLKETFFLEILYTLMKHIHVYTLYNMYNILRKHIFYTIKYNIKLVQPCNYLLFSTCTLNLYEMYTIISCLCTILLSI